GLFFAVAVRGTGQNPKEFLVGFPAIFLLAVLSYLLAAQSTMQHYGISYAVWAIIIGLLISNTVGTPAWVRPALRLELYIKTGLVLLGAEILLNKIVTIGIPGVFIAWGCTPIILITTFWFGQNVLKMQSKTLNMVVSAAMSVCGTSAAIATAAACRAKKEELTFAIGLSMVFTSVMMVVMPMFIQSVNMHDVLAGAWLGGTIDATGAVAAAGSLVSERAMYVATTIKMIQNILIGIVAFCVAVYWVVKVEQKTEGKVDFMEIWRRVPKFVIGFVAASIIFSSLYALLGDDVGYAVVEQGIIGSGTKLFRGWFFCLSFVAIGLECNFRELKECFRDGKTLLLYLFGQSLQLVLSLLMAYLAFFILFPHIMENI
ncbi:MAG: putative sulfate exporter family transporter, partial [Candidatus Electrothrix sp. MAN1_4]|nr:putative sulfate exporter family transporter [Candidatus Electrothrix sp. MAN1_4]